jgi:hypothetical protein
MPLSLRPSPGNAVSNEAGSDSNIDDTPDTGYTFDSSLSRFNCLATVLELRMGSAALY